MGQKPFNPTELTADQRSRLVNIISESSPDLGLDEFSDKVLTLLEDVAGFESVSDSETKSIINELWSLYHDQSK